MVKHETSTEHGRAGKALGTAGAETRAALLDELERQLGTTPWRQVKVLEITREVGCSPASFYQYFANLEDAFDALIKRRAGQKREPAEHIQLIADLLKFEAGAL